MTIPVCSNLLPEEGGAGPEAAPQSDSQSHNPGFSVDKRGYFEGYASVFNVVDLHGDKVLPGAFGDSIQRHQRCNSFPKMLWQHQSHAEIGTIRLIIF